MKQFKNLISQTLARHGIEKEVASHQVVKEARAILAVILPPHAQTDIDVRSFRNSQLRIACLHPVALSVVRKHEPLLRDRLVQVIPRLELTRIVSFVDTRSNDGS